MYKKITRLTLILIIGINLNAFSLKSQTLKADFTIKVECHIGIFTITCAGNPDYLIFDTDGIREYFVYPWPDKLGHYYDDGNRSTKIIIYRSDTVNGVITRQSDSITKNFIIDCDTCIDAELDLQFDT